MTHSSGGQGWIVSGRGAEGISSSVGDRGRRFSRRHRLPLSWKPRVTFEQFRLFLSRVQRDPALRRQVEEAITADEVARLAQDLGFSVSGSDILRFSGQSAAGVRVTRIDHPGEYPGRYY